MPRVDLCSRSGTGGVSWLCVCEQTPTPLGSVMTVYLEVLGLIIYCLYGVAEACRGPSDAPEDSIMMLCF